MTNPMHRTPTKPRTNGRANQPPPVPTSSHEKTNAHASDEPSLNDEAGSERIPETQVTASPSGLSSRPPPAPRSGSPNRREPRLIQTTIQTQGPAAAVTPPPKKRNRKSNPADNSPSKKHRTKAKVTANRNDDSTDTLNQLTSLMIGNVEKLVKKALSKQDGRY